VEANVYVDGFNLYYGALKHRPRYKWLDLDAFAKQLLLPGDTLKRIRYFTARASGVPDPGTPQRQDTFLRALATIPHLSIHEGTFKTNEIHAPLVTAPPSGSRMVKVFKTEEKGSDVNLATYLLLDAFKGDAGCAIVASDDFDLKEPMLLAQSELGLKLGVVSPRCRTWLRSAVKASFYRPVKEPLLKACQFPYQLSDAKGTITRPKAWK
jgi:hypothetical protein